MNSASGDKVCEEELNFTAENALTTREEGRKRGEDRRYRRRTQEPPI
jgi:hypothetical protein